MELQKILNIFEDHGLNENNCSFFKQENITDIAKDIEKAINYTRCCTELKAVKNKFTFKNWLFSNGIRYVSGHNYKSSDGDVYDVDELEKMYRHYLSL